MVYALVRRRRHRHRRRRRRSVQRFYRYPSRGRNFSAILFIFGGYVYGYKSLFGIVIGLISKNKMAARAIFMSKNAIFRQLVLLTCKSNLSIIDIRDRYMYLHHTCEPLTLRLFLEGRPGGVKVRHRDNYVIGCVSSLIIGPRGLGCIGSLQENMSCESFDDVRFDL